MKIQKSFYLNDDVVFMARAFLGKILSTNIDGLYTSGVITETEAYAGIDDKASHAFGNRHTQRTAPMYLDGGVGYVYLCYGMHSLFNIVSAPSGVPHAILIRSIHPLDGLTIMQKRRKLLHYKGLSNGPGKVSQALGIHYTDSGTDLCGDRIWIEDRGIIADSERITSTPRVGVDYAQEDALLHYRFVFEWC
jgi:DNA-3-methyladenine glycosylase